MAMHTTRENQRQFAMTSGGTDGGAGTPLSSRDGFSRLETATTINTSQPFCFSKEIEIALSVHYLQKHFTYACVVEKQPVGLLSPVWSRTTFDLDVYLDRTGQRVHIDQD